MERRPVEDKVAEWAVIRPVAEAARNDGNDLTAWRHEIQRKRDERGIEIYGLDPDAAENKAVLLVTVYLFVWRIQDCMGESGEALQNAQRRGGNEVLRDHAGCDR